MRSRTRRGMSTYVSVVISPATTTRPVVMSVSQATRPVGSSARTASSTESEIWSAILSGWPSVTDSEVKENERLDIAGTLARELPAGSSHRYVAVTRLHDCVSRSLDSLGWSETTRDAFVMVAATGRWFARRWFETLRPECGPGPEAKTPAQR